MAKTIYTSVRDVDVRTCDPQPLLRENFLSEFRTSVEKLKVCENLGAVSSDYLRWENILGDDVEKSTVLKDYIKEQFKYSNERVSTVSDVKSTLDHLIDFTYKLPTLEINVGALSIKVDNYKETFEAYKSVTDASISNLESEVDSLKETVGTFKNSFEQVDSKLNQINQLLGEDGFMYDSQLDPERTAPSTIGGIKKGTKVSELTTKSIIEVFNQIIFPATQPTFTYPTLTCNCEPRITEVGGSINFTYNYQQNDAGEITSVVQTVDGENVTDGAITLNNRGRYTYQVVINYDKGQDKTDSDGNTVEGIPAGEKSASCVAYANYPYYINDTEKPAEQLGKTIIIEQSGIESVKFYGSTYNIKVVTSVGDLDANMNLWKISDNDGWTTLTTEKDNSVTYKISITV